jgi:hypothetical protein
MASANKQQTSLSTLPAELLVHITIYLDLPDILRLRSTFNRAVVGKTECHYATLLARELRKGIWLSSHTLRTLEAVGRNHVIARQIKHIDFNVLYLEIINEWQCAISAIESATQHFQFDAFAKAENHFLDREDLDLVLGEQLRAFLALSNITTKSTHTFGHETRAECLGGLAGELQTLRDRYKLNGQHVPSGNAPSMQMELKVYHAAAKARLQLTEVSFCASPVDLLSHLDLVANVECCYLLGIGKMFNLDAPLTGSALSRILAVMPKLRTLYLVVGWLRWSNLFASHPYSMLDWGLETDLSEVAWPAHLEQLEIVRAKLRPSKAAFLDGLPNIIRCNIIEAKNRAPSMSAIRSEYMYNVDCFG